tara:strand:+ start:1291 stop:1899 length:609 start_codon:yes stop_codon:yes gene_type:complete
MKSNEMINQIKTLLNIEVKLEELKLENGTIVSAESFEKDKEIFIVTDDEKVAMPVGEYLLEDGRLVVVSEEGMIADVRDVADEVPAKETEEGEEITSDLEEDKKEDKKEEMGYATKEELSSAVAEIKANIEEIKEMMKPKEEDLSDDADKLKTRTVKEEFSEAASKPIKHNPESVSKKTQINFAKGKFNTTAMERVLNKLNK